MKVCLINLGCAKNFVDSEAILSLVNSKDFEIVTDENEADLIIINTCAFIHDAENETYDTIQYFKNLNKKLIVVGCYVEKYKKSLYDKFPFVDEFVGFKDFLKLPKIIEKVTKIKINKPYDIFQRVEEENSFSTYLKISEGCNHSCGYCIIPHLRGKYYSYDEDKILEYVKNSVSKGIKEFTIIAQDTSYYGKDFLKKEVTLAGLLRKIDQIEGVKFIRVLYLYPNEVDDELIKAFKECKHVVPYFDLPIQHASDKILKLMNRFDTYESLTKLISNIRKEIPNAIFRCTIIVGYPHENNRDFNMLKRFLTQNRIHHVGVFTFSNEKNTKAYNLSCHVDEDIKEARKQELMNFQRKISYELNKEMVGKEYEGIVIGEKGNNTYYIRTEFNAPDDIDGSVYMVSNKKHNLGDIVKVKIEEAFVYDLYSTEIQ